MKTFIKIGYTFDELSENAKETVKKWYLDDPIRSEFLSDEFENAYINYFFPESNLKTQWSLSYCQGDGVNIYGELDLLDVINYIKNYNPAEHKDKEYKNPFTDKEIKRLEWYIDNLQYTSKYAKIPANRHYCYCIANKIDILYDIIDDHEQQQHRNIDEKLIKHFESEVIEIIENLCADMEEYGYNYLYEVDNEEVSEICEANNWYFDEDGNFIHELEYENN